MLLSFRLPLVDLRSCSSTPAIASSVRVPRQWNERDFVRGFGPIKPRPNTNLGFWAFEGAYADASRAIAITEKDFRSLDKSLGEFSLAALNRRMWHALPHSDALIDIDIAAQVVPRADHRSLYPKDQRSIGLSQVSQHVANLGAARFRIGPAAKKVSGSLAHPSYSRALAEYYNRATFSGSSDDLPELVRHGQLAVVVEAPGFQTVRDLHTQTESASYNDITLDTYQVRVNDQFTTRIFVLSSKSVGKTARRRIRELRMNLMRLHSLHELLYRLGTTLSRSPSALATTESNEYDNLQDTLLTAVREVQRVSYGAQPHQADLIAAAFDAYSYVASGNLTTVMHRTLGSARPKLRTAVETLQALEAERHRDHDIVRMQRQHPQPAIPATIKVESILVTYINNGNASAFGHNATSNNTDMSQSNVTSNIMTDVVTLGDLQTTRTAILTDLRKLRESLENDGTLSHEALKEGSQLITEAINTVPVDEETELLSKVKVIGSWIGTTATSLVVSVVAPTIASLLGVS
jgi:hypothetical protein